MLNFSISKSFCKPIFIKILSRGKFDTNDFQVLKELQNCILWIIRVWSVFYSVRVYISLHFLPIIF